MTNCLCTHSSVIFMFISLIAAQLGKWTPIQPSQECINILPLEYNHYSIYIHYDWNHLILITSNRILCLWHTENLHFSIIKAVYVCLIWTKDILPLCKTFFRKHKMALYFLPFHNTVLRKGPEILPHRRQWPTQSIPGLVMIWQCKKPKQLQPWYWLINSEYCFRHQMS